MELGEIQNNPKYTRSFKTIRQLWLELISLKRLDRNFLIPKDAGDWKILDLASSPDLSLTEDARSKLRKLVDLIYGLDFLRSNNSYRVVYNQVEIAIRHDICILIIEKTKVDFNQSFIDLINHIIDLCHNYGYYRLITGIELTDIDFLQIGNIKIAPFTQAEFDILIKDRPESDFIIALKRFVDTNFLNNLCLYSEVFGDEHYAREMSLVRCRQVINILRFIFCELYRHFVYDNIVKINLKSEAINSTEVQLFIERDNMRFGFGNERNIEPAESFKLSRSIFDKLIIYSTLNEMGKIYEENSQMELDQAIMTSVYWIGEAQNECFAHDAFIKYWIGIEALVYNQSDTEVTKGICRAISTLLISCFGHYYNYKSVHTNMKRLYKKRCSIVHKGAYDQISYEELTKICEYAVESVRRCCFLRRFGYKTLDDVKVHCGAVYRSLPQAWRDDDSLEDA